VIRRVTWSNTQRALALSVWARARDEWRDLHAALYHAYWAESADLGDAAVLIRIASQVGIPGEEAAIALAEGSGLQTLAREQQRALDLGIGNTPGWHLGGGVVFTGIHDRTVFDRVIERRLEEQR
jgi:predicted DsbA family dithiol-disulfide isomerase